MNPIRSVLAIFVGLGVILFTTQALEVVLVRATADEAIQDLETFLLAANQPVMLGTKLVYSGLMAVLGGYLVAKVAVGATMLHGVFAAGLLAAANISGYATDELAAYVPMAARVALVLTMSGGLLVGATIRARAAAIEVESQGPPTRAGSLGAGEADRTS
jgi:hypothetical protein